MTVNIYGAGSKVRQQPAEYPFLQVVVVVVGLLRVEVVEGWFMFVQVDGQKQKRKVAKIG